MERRIIELAKAKKEFEEICREHGVCSECPFFVQGKGCIAESEGKIKEAEKELDDLEAVDLPPEVKKVLVEDGIEESKPEYKAEMDEAEGDFALPRMEDVRKAKATLENHCAGMECDYCPLWREDTGRCTVGMPAAWRLKSEEQPETKEEPKPSFTPTEKRKRVLDDAIDVVCRDRCEMYGEVEDNFGVIAELWSAYLNAGMLEGSCKVDLGAMQVAEMMILFKVGRAATAMEEHRDTYVDIAGYAACAGGMCDEENV